MTKKELLTKLKDAGHYKNFYSANKCHLIKAVSLIQKNEYPHVWIKYTSKIGLDSYTLANSGNIDMVVIDKKYLKGFMCQFEKTVSFHPTIKDAFNFIEALAEYKHHFGSVKNITN